MEMEYAEKGGTMTDVRCTSGVLDNFAAKIQNAHGLEVFEGKISRFNKQITGRCDQKTQDFEGPTKQDAVTSLDSVEDPDISTPSHVPCQVDAQSNALASTRTEASNTIYTGGDSLQLIPPFETHTSIHWRCKDVRSKTFGVTQSPAVTTVTSSTILETSCYAKDTRKTGSPCSY